MLVGLDRVWAAIKQHKPDLVLENCEDGGTMLTFKVLIGTHTHTHILAHPGAGTDVSLCNFLCRWRRSSTRLSTSMIATRMLFARYPRLTPIPTLTSITLARTVPKVLFQGNYGFSYPFAPRYSAKYHSDPINEYTLRSCLFGTACSRIE